VAEEEAERKCGPCENSAAIAVAYEICVQNAEKDKCDLVMDKLNKGEIQSIEQLVSEYKKVVPESAHQLLDEILSWAEEGGGEAETAEEAE